MSVKLHRQAEQLMAEADLLEIDGRHDKARGRWLKAAQMEAEAFSQIPRDRAKTRGIIAVSVIALHRRAGALDEAIRLGHDYLATGGLPEAAQAELRGLLETLAQERQSRTGRRSPGIVYNSNSLTDRIRDWFERSPKAQRVYARLSADLDTVVERVESATSGLRERVAPIIDPVSRDPEPETHDSEADSSETETSLPKDRPTGATEREAKESGA